MPNGQVPVLEIDGKVMFQSAAICRYLATIVGLSGANAMENYEIDNVVDTMNDLRFSENSLTFYLKYFKLIKNISRAR